MEKNGEQAQCRASLEKLVRVRAPAQLRGNIAPRLCNVDGPIARVHETFIICHLVQKSKTMPRFITVLKFIN